MKKLYTDRIIGIGIAISIALVILFLTIFLRPASAAEDWERARLVRAEPSSVYEGETRVTIHVPENVPLGYWYTCNFYRIRNVNGSKWSEVVASAHHVLRERVPSTTIVLADPSHIQFILCKRG